MIGIDIRSLQDPVARGVFSYAQPLIAEMERQAGHDEFRYFRKGRLPSKVSNFGMRFLGSPAIDGQLGVRNVFLPNLNFWSVSETARVTVTVHDLSFLVNPSWFTAKERLWHRLIGVRGLLDRADAVITLSAHTKQELTELLAVDPQKIRHIPPGVPPLAADHEPVFSFPYVLFIGVIEPRKNIDGALAAFELLAERNPDIHLVLAGRHADSDRKPTGKFPDRTHFLGQVTPEKKAALFRNAQALFLPSFYEGFGFPPLEAMSAGVPVVASSAGPLPETIGDAGLLLDPLDTAGFAAALEQVLDDSALRQTLIARGLERVKLFSWEKCAEETLKTICG